ncbi:hypothetical protein ACHAXS_006546 [Conticribra weissflogii]
MNRLQSTFILFLATGRYIPSFESPIHLLASALSTSLSNVSPQSTVPTSSCYANTPQTSSAVRVWDNVLESNDHRNELHSYAAKSGLGHKCFSYPIQNPERKNIIELTLDAILTEMEDREEIKRGPRSAKQYYVEYWTRQEWRHIEAHADVDENLAKFHDANPTEREVGDLMTKFPDTYKNGYRYPIHGHVLYLQIGSEVKGPTCIFPGRSSGGDLLKSLSTEKENHDNEAYCSSQSKSTNDIDKNDNHVQLITVPAKAGRLLRFHGRDLHAVPRPHDLWMLPFVKGSPEIEPGQVWGRSVILFNVWPGDEDPPLGVPLDLNEEEWFRREENLCNKFEEWVEESILLRTTPQQSADPSANKPVKVWLLGNDRRRGYPMRTVPLFAEEDGGRELVREALGEESQVSMLWLTNKK